MIRKKHKKEELSQEKLIESLIEKGVPKKDAEKITTTKIENKNQKK